MLRKILVLVVITLLHRNLAVAVEGDSLWSQYYNTYTSIGRGEAIVPAIGDSFMIAGTMYTSGSHLNFCLWNINNTGQLGWTKNYGGTSEEILYSMCKTRDDGYLLAGAESYPQPPALIIKVNAQGDCTWSVTPPGYAVHDVISISDGYFYVGDGSGTTYYGKIDLSGNLIWCDSLYAGYGCFANSVIETTDGFVFAGFVQQVLPIGSKMWIVKISAQGDTIWSNTFGTIVGYGSTATDVIQTDDSGYLMAGINPDSSGLSDIYLVKVDVNGDSVWAKSHGGPNAQAAYNIIHTSDNNYLICGNTTTTADDYDIVAMKVDANGDSIWYMTYGTNYEDGALAAIEDGNGNYLITGYTWWGWVPNLSQILLMCIEGIPNAVNPNFSFIASHTLILHPSRPNPFNSSTAISYELRAASHASLKVYDTAGRLVTTLVDGWQEAGTHEAIFDGSGLTAGVYLVRLETDGQVAVKKAVLLK